VIELRTGTTIWVVAGVTDMRRGFPGLSAQVQTVLHQQPFSEHVFVFRGRRGDTVKPLWWDGEGLCLFTKRLVGGRFIWSQSRDGTVSLTRAQLSMLLEGSIGGRRNGPGRRRLQSSWQARFPCIHAPFRAAFRSSLWHTALLDAAAPPSKWTERRSAEALLIAQHRTVIGSHAEQIEHLKLTIKKLRTQNPKTKPF
jgi:transposase